MDNGVVEKIYCCDRGNNNDALVASILSNRNGNCMDGWGNGSLAYLLLFLLFGREGYGFGGANGAAAVAGRQGEELQTQINAIRTQLQDNQNTDCLKQAIAGNGAAIAQLSNTLNINYNTLQNCCCQIQAALQNVGGKVDMTAQQVINAIERGNTGLLAAIKDCCCQTQQAVTKMGYENQLAVKDLSGAIQTGFDRTNTGVERGFSQLGYQNAQDKCDIVRAIENGNQGIKDLLNSHWNTEQANELQSVKFELSQRKQNEYITQLIAQAKNNGCNCNGGCNGGCGCGL